MKIKNLHLLDAVIIAAFLVFLWSVISEAKASEPLLVFAATLQSLSPGHNSCARVWMLKADYRSDDHVEWLYACRMVETAGGRR